MTAAGRQRSAAATSAWYRFDEDERADRGRLVGEGTGRPARLAPTGTPARAIPGSCPRTRRRSSSGSRSSPPTRHASGRRTTRCHKILAGLLDAHELAGNEQALDIVREDRRLGRTAGSGLCPEQFDRMWNIYIAGEYGGMNDGARRPARAEPASRSTSPTAKCFDNRELQGPTIANSDILDGRHANQHIPQFIGYLRIFEQSEERDYHTAADELLGHGGAAPTSTRRRLGSAIGEIFCARDVIAGSSTRATNHAETCASTTCSS